MNLLIVAATAAEILKPQPLPASPSFDYRSEQAEGRRGSVEVLITGVGMLATAYALTKHFQANNNYDLVLQAGVGGSFDHSIALGSLVFITSDQYGDLGAEDHDNYLDIFEMGLFDKNTAPHTDGRLHTPLLPIHEKIDLPRVNALTVNTVSGSERTIKQRAGKYNCAIESMEGAAFHYVCLQEGVPFAQVRAISNYVTPRDKSQWKMKDAIINLNNWLTTFIETLNT